MKSYDIIVIGGGVAGLYVAARLLRAGYNVIVFEKDKIGGGQTLASQGMIHGGQKYALGGAATDQARLVAEMPARWDACFGGYGDIDLTPTKVLGETQVMFPAGSLIANVSAMAAAKAVNGATEKIKKEDYPDIFLQNKKFKGPVYVLREKVVDVKSLLAALAQRLKGRIFKGAPEELLPDGQVAINGEAFRAETIIFLAGAGNEDALKLLRVEEKKTQRRPLRQVMVRPMPEPLFGHGIIGHPKPRVTVTSHPLPDGHYVWYLGGMIAEKGTEMTAEETLSFAQKEMSEIFPHIAWHEKEWASFAVDRAEPLHDKGHLPSGPEVHQRGKILIAWPTKMTLVPALSDRIFDWLSTRGVVPQSKTAPPAFSTPEMGHYPWEDATWKKIS